MLKQKIITLRRRTVTKADKSTLESQVRSMKDMENFIRGSLEKELRRAEGIHPFFCFVFFTSLISHGYFPFLPMATSQH